MAFKIEFDDNNMPIAPSFLLTKRNGDTLGFITNIDSININANTDIPTVSFQVYKDADGVRCGVWDDLTDLRLIYCIEWDAWFEITVSLSDSTAVTKDVNGTHLPQAELSQIMLYEIEINTEDDIARDDYTTPTVIYNPNNADASLLNRLIADKAPHYSIHYVSPSLMNLQRTFSFDNTSIKDAFDQIAEEINGVFIYGESTDTRRIPKRTISLYDLSYICNNCGYRGDIFDECPECGSTNITSGYGKDTTIFVSKDNLTDEVDYSVNVDSVKNCFKLEAGDDLMTASIINCNPNGSAYLWYISEEMKKDMPSALVSKINQYDRLYEQYNSTKEFNLSGSKLINYNRLVSKYMLDEYNEKALINPIVGFPSLTKIMYDLIDFKLYLTDGMLPTYHMSDTSASEQVALLIAKNMSPMSVANYNALSASTADNYALEMAKILVDSRYEVKINESSFDSSTYTWSGNFRVTNYSDEEDTALSRNVKIRITDDYTNYVQQKINKLINKNEVEDYSLSSILKLNATKLSNGSFSGDLPKELKKYNIASLKYMQSACQSVIDILIEEGIGDDIAWTTSEQNLYNQLYEPYFTRLQAIEYEIGVKDADIALIESLYTEVNGLRDTAQKALNFQKYLGNDLWKVFCSYRREDTYSNQNFISDGLSNAQLFENVKEFMDGAKKEIVKSATSQHQISSTFKNLLTIKEFQKLTDYFDVWNWLRIEVDGEIYKLRLVSYNINFDNLENIDVDFSDIIRGGTVASDSKSLMSNMSSIASSYNAVTKQSEAGLKAQIQNKKWQDEGFSAETTPFVNSSNNAIKFDKHGMLFRSYDEPSDTYSPTQLKIINSTLAITSDAWQTTKAAIGLFKYTDPETGRQRNAYGVNGEVIVGKLLLGESLGIYNSDASMKFNQNGLVVTNGINTIAINPNANSLFTVSNRLSDVISFDTSGNGVFNGTLYAESGDVGGYHITHYNLYTQFSTQSVIWTQRQATDEYGNLLYETELAFDSHGNPIYETDGQGNTVYVTEVVYDSNGNITYETDQNGDIIYDEVFVYDENGDVMYDDEGQPITRYEPRVATITTPVQATIQVPVMEDVQVTTDNYINNYTVLSSTGNIALSVGATTTTTTDGATIPNASSGKILLYNNGQMTSGNHTITNGTGEPDIFMNRTRSSGKTTQSCVYSWDSDDPAFSFRFRPSTSDSWVYSTIINKDGVHPNPANERSLGLSGRRWKNIYGINLDMSYNGVVYLPNIIRMRDDSNRNRAVIYLYNDGTQNCGSNLIINGAGNSFFGSGESAINLYNAAYRNNTAENLFLSSDTHMYFFVNCQTIANRKYLVLNNALTFYPSVNATGNLGAGSYRWNNIYSAHAVSVSSDERIKKDMEEIYKAKELLMHVIPYQFRFTNEGADRIHYGFSAQQFKRAMTEVGIDDCGAFTLDITDAGKRNGHNRQTATEDEKVYGLRYEELIAPIVQVLQEFEQRLNSIEQRLSM